ncbi:hypothetical protein BAL199_24124 [alpha proteobacterium BAL199]|jgi:hypothetical protein|nr:hypothetical protein BAL199_24124 [alpha proteobacterium BAL199]
MGNTHTLDLGGVLARVLFCIFIVFSAYNASGYSYYHWVTSDALQPPSEHVLQIAIAGALGFGFYTIGDITRRSLQKGGVGLITIMFAAASWYLVEAEWVELRTTDDLITAGQLTVVGILTFGVSFSFLHYRLGGVKQVEET